MSDLFLSDIFSERANSGSLETDQIVSKLSEYPNFGQTPIPSLFGHPTCESGLGEKTQATKFHESGPIKFREVNFTKRDKPKEIPKQVPNLSQNTDYNLPNNISSHVFQPCYPSLASSIDILNGKKSIFSQTEDFHTGINNSAHAPEDSKVADRLNQFFLKIRTKFSTRTSSPIISPGSNIQMSSNTLESNCSGLIPIIRNLTPQNYGSFLVVIMEALSDQISLEEFYDLLHQSTTSEPFRFVNNTNKVNFSAIGNGSDAFKIFSFVVQTFKKANGDFTSRGPGSKIQNSLSSLNFDEFLRTFLAIKVLVDAITEVDEKHSETTFLPRASLFNAYCEICKRLSGRFKKASGSSKFHTNTVVGMSQFGKITKIVFPNLKFRRLGGRGKSKTHYFGISWNTQIVDSELIEIADSKGPKPRNLSASKKMNEVRQGSKKVNANAVSNQKSGSQMLRPTFLSKESPYSFVENSSKIPKAHCSLRVSDILDGIPPQQSGWSKRTMLQSVTTLKTYNVDLMPVIQNFQQNILSPLKTNFFHAQFVERMKILIGCNSNREGYMNLYLTVLLLLFPLILSSDQEICTEVKKNLRQNLVSFVTQVRWDLPHVPKQETNYFINFLNIIRKMIHMNEMSSSCVKKELTEDIKVKIASYLRPPMTNQTEYGNKSSIEEIIFEAVIMASKAFSAAFVNETQDEPANINFIKNVTETFLKFSCTKNELIIDVLEAACSQDTKNKRFNLPFQMFHKVSQLFHQFCLSDEYLTKLPTQVISFILRQINRGIQELSFRQFNRRDPEVSKETFKTWWIYSALSEEYMQVLAETVALSASEQKNEC